MPYDADLRCSYCFTELNMSWYYEAMSEYNIGIEFMGNRKDSIYRFERDVERAFNDWVVYKVFDHKRGEYNYDFYENVWEFLRDYTTDYEKVHPHVIQLTFEDMKEEEEN